MIPAEQLIRNRTKMRLCDRIVADSNELNRLQSEAFMWLKPMPPKAELLKRRIDFCWALMKSI